jgi:hypothetical protein
MEISSTGTRYFAASAARPLIVSQFNGQVCVTREIKLKISE